MEWDELLKFAIVKCKLSPDEFWSLTWREFHFYVDRVKDEFETQKIIQEKEWDRTRQIWTVLMNTNFKKKGGGKYEPEDLIRLSFDKPETIQEKPTLETFERLVQKHGKRRKKNGK